MKGTYVGLKLTSDSSNKLEKYIKEIGLDNAIPKDKFHMTLYYANEKPIEGFEPDPDKVYESYVIGYKFLGKDEWAAIVLELFSPEIFKRHKHIAKFGSPHSYPEFIQHVSLKYKPTPEDISKLADSCPLGMTIDLTGEYVEELKD